MTSIFSEAVTPSGRITVEVCGPADAPPLLMSTLSTSRGTAAALQSPYRSALERHYRLVFWDYPPATVDGQGARAVPMTPERVADDIVAVADAAGVGRFAYFGYSWGANSGLQMAARHGSRVSALAVGGWPAIGGNFAAMLSACRGMGELMRNPERVPKLAAMVPADPVLREQMARQYRRFVEYYDALQAFDAGAERALAQSLTMPRLNFCDALDNGAAAIGALADIGPALIRHEAELRAMGWTTRVLHTTNDPDAAHGTAMAADVVAPLLRELLDAGS